MIKRAGPTAPHFSSVNRKTETTGERDMTCNSRHWHNDPNIKGLYAEAHSLRDIVLRRLAAIGCEINERSLPKAQAIVSANVGELVAVPEYATLLDCPSGENRILALLIQSCAADLDTKIKSVAERRRESALRRIPRGMPLRLVTQNGELR
jgi:hypothetical protein